MALNSNTLKQALLAYVEPGDAAPASFPGSMAIAATRWMQAYDEYASAALDASLDTLDTKYPLRFEDAMASLAGPVGSAHAAAVAFDNAVQGYWNGAKFRTLLLPPAGVGGTGVFAAETSSVARVTPGIVTGFVEAALAVPTSSRDDAAGLLADALHTGTLAAVAVTITGLDTTPTPTGPLPIVNTEGIT